MRAFLHRYAPLPGIALVLLASTATAAWAQGDAGADTDPVIHAGAIPPAPLPNSDEGPTLMVLEASVNGMATHQLVTMKRLADGSFLARGEELRQIRIKLDPAMSDAEYVALAALGISARYDEARQAIALTVPVERLETFVIGLGGQRRPTDLGLIQPLSGFVLNYGLYASRSSDLTLVSGDVEALAMTPVGIFSTTGLFNSARAYGGERGAVRLDSSWRLVDPRAIRSYRIGDFASNALSWTGSVRLGGFQIASAFDQRTDIVTTALPQFSGSAALPSTLDLYVNQQRVYSGEIPSGPFDRRALPYLSGGDFRLVTTDMNGQQVEINQSYYYVARQLREGIVQYSLDVGAPRTGYGRKSFGYDDTVFASGTARYGLNGRVTVEGRAEASADGLANGGVGAVASVGGFGAIGGSVSVSNYDGYTGAKYAIEAEAQLAGIRFFANTERTIDDYFDLSRVAILRDSRRHGAPDGDETDWLNSTARASKLDRIGFSFTPWFDPTSVNISYNRIETPGLDQRTGSLSLTRRIGNRISLYANGFVDLDRSDRFGLFATLNVRLGRDVSASAGIQHDTDRTAYIFQATGATSRRQGDVGWGISDREYDDGSAQRSAYVSYRAREALLRAQVDESGGEWRASARAEGSIVAAGGGVFMANRIGESFAIVRNAGPGVEVMQGGVPMGKADGAGRALLPDIIPYYEQRITIDPTALPDGWEAAATERVAAAGYRQSTIVDFGARRVHGAVLILQRRDGSPIPPGYTVRLDGGGQALVGYDGQAYLRGLGESNRITIDLGPDGVCSASFPYDMDGAVQPQIGPLTCQ